MKVEVTIPAEKVRFKQETEELDIHWLYGNCILYTCVTLLFLIFSLHFIDPHVEWHKLPAGLFSSIFCSVTVALIILICIQSYEYSCFLMDAYCSWKIGFQLFGMVDVLISLLELNVTDTVPKNDMPIRHLIMEISIILIAMIVGQTNESFLQRVVLAKEKASRPRLVISWAKKDKKDKKQDELLKYEVKNEKDDNKNPMIFTIGNNVIQSNNEMKPIKYIP